VAACLPAAEYKRVFQARAAGERAPLPDGSVMAQMPRDCAVTRKQARVLQFFKTGAVRCAIPHISMRLPGRGLRKASRICFSVSINAKKTAPIATMMMPSNSGTPCVPKTA